VALINKTYHVSLLEQELVVNLTNTVIFVSDEAIPLSIVISLQPRILLKSCYTEYSCTENSSILTRRFSSAEVIELMYRSNT
jgi:hypothetical protein